MARKTALDIALAVVQRECDTGERVPGACPFTLFPFQIRFEASLDDMHGEPVLVIEHALKVGDRDGGSLRLTASDALTLKDLMLRLHEFQDEPK